MSIKISKNAHLCAACGNDFQHDQTITSTVKKWEGALHREDFCKDCWREERNKEAYSVWNMVYHDPKLESEEPPEVFSPLRQLFYEAAEEESRIEMAKAFLAAGLLRRQKVFRLIKESDEAEGNIRVTLYTDRLGNRLIEVPDPQFTYAELETARVRLLERLQELETAAAPAEGEDTANTLAEPALSTAEGQDGAPEPELGASVDESAAGDMADLEDRKDEEDGDDDEYDDDEYDDEDDDEDDEDESVTPEEDAEVGDAPLADDAPAGDEIIEEEVLHAQA